MLQWPISSQPISVRPPNPCQNRPTHHSPSQPRSYSLYTLSATLVCVTMAQSIQPILAPLLSILLSIIQNPTSKHPCIQLPAPFSHALYCFSKKDPLVKCPCVQLPAPNLLVHSAPRPISISSQLSPLQYPSYSPFTLRPRPRPHTKVHSTSFPCSHHPSH